MTDQINERKIEHIKIINSDENIDRRKYYFDSIQLKHRALPEIDLDKVDTSIEFMGKKLSFPLLISSMTGGAQELVQRINKNLVLAAEKAKVAMGVGSQRVMFSHPGAKKSFELRQYAPTTLLFANLGAVQLNYNFGLEHCRQAIQTVGADGLYLHLNPLQESIQPEGDTNFSGLADKIGDIAQNIDTPLILKEVGAGISYEDVNLVVDNGIKYIDVAGSGGTSWSRIEEFRRQKHQKDNIGITFQDWGNPTPLVLKSLKPLRNKITLIASGGIRTGIDMVKANILGASLCGLAKPFLKPAMESADAVLAVIDRIKKEYKIAMFLTGVDNFKTLHYNESLIQDNFTYRG